MIKKVIKMKKYFNLSFFTFLLLEASADTRRYCRLFKSLSEAYGMHKLFLMQSTETAKVDEFNRLLSVIIRAAYCLYYLYDNIYIL